MRRRQFIKITTAASITFSTMPMVGCLKDVNQKELSLKKATSLKGYDDEQEENPTLVSNQKGDIWMFALRRMSYPNDSELVSAFWYDGTSWRETTPITTTAGQYEVPTAACAPNGKPVVAWTEKKNDAWLVNVARMISGGETQQHTFTTPSGRAINPVLIAPDTHRNWMAWENFHNGKFTICISKYNKGKWSEPIVIDKGESSCFDPSIAEAQNGDLYIVYALTDGFHQNIELSIINGESLHVNTTIPVAIGGGHKNRVNINAKPALAFDTQGNLWISYENNRHTSRLEDGDNYTGDRCCAIVAYRNGELVEVENNNKWLFNKENDHRPTFVKDIKGNLYLFTHCGGTFKDSAWKYRISWLDPRNGWQQPKTLLNTKVKGLTITPAIVFDKNNDFWLATNNEKFHKNKENTTSESYTQSRLTNLSLMHFQSPKVSNNFKPIKFVKTTIKEYTPDEKTIGTLSGHPKVKRRTKLIDGEKYTLIYGNLHEHSNSSNCWPAGNDGSLHEDYRFGMFAEGYDFFGMTDHASSMSEIHWRKNLRIADFYNESEKFIAMPAVEWTLQSNPELDNIQHGAGHYNIIFSGTEDAQKYIRNKYEVYCPRTPESDIAPTLWKMLDEKQINCVTIPHHTADEIHPVDWNVTDPKYVTAVEIFQCRGNNEYPGCPRENNLSRHKTTHHKHAFIDYALKIKKYKMGFIASGDHNSMGIGVAALWVKELSREGIIDALRNRRTFATTGDKMFVDFTINGTEMGSVCNLNKRPEIAIDVVGQYPLEKVEVLKNSDVIHTFNLSDGRLNFQETFIDHQYKDNEEAYYYIRATQKNKALAWSSPIWIETI